MQQTILLANPRGFCAGVDRAIAIVEQALKKFGAPIYVRHEVVHNKFVVDNLKAKGAIFIEDLKDAPIGSTLIYSAHGVPLSVRREAEERGLNVFDATCPLVTKVHLEAKRFAAEGMQILLIGHEGHEEVVGTMGEAPDAMTLVESPADADMVSVDPERPLVWLSQTTLSVDETLETVDRLQERFPHLQSPPSDDICYATQNRQAAVKQIAEQCDLLIVVGSGNSSNSVRLVEVGLESGAASSYRVDGVDELDEAWLDGVSTVGLTSGASVPEVLVDGVLAWLAERGFGDVEEVTAAEETLVFALPPELRRDLKAAGSA
jgi:4-hydroxy-3-methylbut-2-enyl diphosphate reductase